MLTDSVRPPACITSGGETTATLSHDSYRYFESIGDLVKTGPTHINVMDVRIMLLGDAQ